MKCLNVFGLLAILASLPLNDVNARPLAERPIISAPRSAIISESDTSAREDTLFLFAAEGPGAYGMPGTTERGYCFDAPNGEAQEAGWYGVDQGGFWWHLASTDISTGHATDMSEALPFDYPSDLTNDYALWCGRLEPCSWEHSPGYGNSWDQRVRIAMPESDVVDIEFDYASDFEGINYDYFQVFVVADGVLTEIFNDNTEGPSGFLHCELHVEGNGDALGDVILSFHSDGAWSDEDSLFITNVGAVWIDNLVASADGEEVFRSDFEDGIEPEGLSYESPITAGDFAELYPGYELLQEDICFFNNSYTWAFFDPETSEPDYGGHSVITYGPPYLDNVVESPLLEVDQLGMPLSLELGDRVIFQFDVYLDLPMDPLIFFYWEVAAWVEGEDCRRTFHNDNYVYYGDFKIWDTWQVDITEYLMESAEGPLESLQGIVVQLGCKDMYPWWGGMEEDPHPPGPYFDNMSISVVRDSPIVWSYREPDYFQDNFQEHSGPADGFVRIDRAGDFDWTDEELPVSIVDSTVITCNMDNVGGPAMEWCDAAGETRPRIYMWYRILDGPNGGQVDPLSGDPYVDPQANGMSTDGLCYSPYIGAEEIDPGSGEFWMKVQADYAHYHGEPEAVEHQWAFDLSDTYFQPGDVIGYFFESFSADGNHETYPFWAMSSDPAIREFFTLRCLGSGYSNMLLVVDGPDVESGWRIALRYNRYSNYDVFVTRAPSSGVSNGLASRATLEDLQSYDTIIWDSGHIGSESICDEDDKTRDDLLLQSWLEQATVPSYLWALGDNVAIDLGQGDPFLSQVLGANLVESNTYYDDRTGIHVPVVYSTHPLLRYLLGMPSFWIYGGCPILENFALVSPVGALTEVLQNWEVDPGDNAVAGIVNNDPDCNGEIVNDQGVWTKAIFNPWSYRHARDMGYALPAGSDYARLFVGHVLERIFSQSSGSLDNAPELPGITQLNGVFPNPFNPTAKIAYSMAQSGKLNIDIFNITGRRLINLWDGPQTAGPHELEWDGRDDHGNRLSSGVYFLRFRAGDVLAEEKLVLLK
jgi:hypothetical protein